MKVLTDRRQVAEALNFGKYPVLWFDMDARKGSKAIVMSRKGLRLRCELYNGYETDSDGVYYLLQGATVMSANHGLYDYLEDVEYANAPVIKNNATVVIVEFSRNTNTMRVILQNAGKVSPDYSTVARFN